MPASAQSIKPIKTAKPGRAAVQGASPAGSPADAGTSLHSPVAAQAALRTFFRIALAWGLSNEEQQKLLGCGRTTFFDWKAGRIKAGLDAATLERLSHIFGIYAGLQILLPIPERADAWVKKPNTAPLFGGRSALERMLAGQVSDLFVVRQYMDAQRGGVA